MAVGKLEGFDLGHTAGYTPVYQPVCPT
ncbi:hypothetical protein F383_03780 [Gossypium arboreum]|uniref:Uncharacterized protein n=1 Tax=Gossypium arboreum TaxID=29729 RepID=A0A0B0P1R2_GOSAR|nr:hypothetical protein F383_03780 [Gossypium arboreum]